MKSIKNIIMTALLMLAGSVSADNLSVSDVEIEAGQTLQIAIGLNNPQQDYVAFQFDLQLPEGITIAKNNKGKLIASLDADRIDDHTLNVSDMGSNTYRFLSFSLTNAEFYGNSGALLNVTLQADASIQPGSKTATIKAQVFTEVNGDQVKWADLPFGITVPSAEQPEPEQCAKPTIKYGNGRLTFDCETEGVSFHYEIKDDDVKSGVASTVDLAVTYTVEVYATRDGYEDSEVATATLCWIDVEPQTEGITEDMPTDVVNVKVQPVLIQQEGTTLTVSGPPAGTPLAVYDLSGRLIKTAKAVEGTTRIDAVTADKVVLVKVGERAVKVVVK